MLQQGHTSIIIKVKLKTELPYYLIGLPLLILCGVLTRPDFSSVWPFALVLTVAIATYCLLTYRLNFIEIDVIKQAIVLTEANVLQMQVKRTYPLDKLQFTYKVGKLGFRARMMNVCRLFVSGKEVAVVMPDRDGWTDETVNSLVKALVRAGVTKKFTGYSMKDATINDL